MSPLWRGPEGRGSSPTTRLVVSLAWGCVGLAVAVWGVWSMRTHGGVGGFTVLYVAAALGGVGIMLVRAGQAYRDLTAPQRKGRPPHEEDGA